MELILDLWLERKDPVLRIRESHQGRLLLQWDRKELRERFFTGALCPEDLQDINLPLWERLGLQPVTVSLPRNRGQAPSL